ncbi:hypothetical protein HZH66_003428 [Vespula vulgaris]|uniref:Uncharacterized protein n=1 Tax=Vespula vulgaris TaxID=7454 RepID=A0A834NCU3_VESVU|nr:hypothetical protein HZH66_003428 [Vespula vulgaris]
MGQLLKEAEKRKSVQSQTPNRYFYEGYKVPESSIDGSKGANLRMKTVIKRPLRDVFQNPFAEILWCPFFTQVISEYEDIFVTYIQVKMLKKSALTSSGYSTKLNAASNFIR